MAEIKMQLINFEHLDSLSKIIWVVLPSAPLNEQKMQLIEP